MNKRKAHKFLSWLLLFFFAVGQLVVFAHQHHAKYKVFTVESHHHTDKHQIVQEKCTFCDQMHQAPINCVHQPDYCYIESAEANVYFNLKLHFTGNSLIHADGLSPPALV